MSFRKALFWIHFAAGCTAGIVVLIMSVTGLLLSYQRQIIPWIDSFEWRSVQVGSERLPIETLIARAGEARGEVSPAVIVMRSDPAVPVEMTFGTSVIYVDPYTGAVLGEGSQAARTFFRTMTTWHRYVGAEGESRPIGKAITGASNLAFLVLVVTGIYLWWPRTLNWMRLKTAMLFRRQATSKARDWNWHTVSGFWTAIPLFFIVISATIISYPWATDLLYYATGNEPPPRPAAAAPAAAATQQAAQRPAAASAAAAPVDLAGLNALWDRAQQQETGWKIITFRRPARAGNPAVFTLDRGNGGRPDLRSTLTLDWQTAEVVRWQTFDGNNSGARLRQWLRWTHTGEVGGLFGQTIGFIACLAGTLLVITGFALAWRRILGWRVRPVPAPAPISEPNFVREPEPARLAQSRQTNAGLVE
jgi:uncharacterized iron-regulated membrane protein